MISAGRKHVVVSTGSSHLRLETISGRNGPCSVSKKSPPESSVPGENLPGSRRNQLRGTWSPPVLGEVPHELSTVAHSKECKRSPQIHSGRIPPQPTSTGTEDSAIPLTTPDMVRSGRVLQTSVKSPLCFSSHPSELLQLYSIICKI